MRKGRWLIALIIVAALLAAGLTYFRREVAVAAGLAPAPFSEAAFEDWIEQDVERLADFTAFSQYLSEQGVDDVVPVWQLTRTDDNTSRLCERPEFLIPPSDDWHRIVPVLKLVRDHIVPEIGPVEVASSYRTTDFNDCMGGASRSKHLGFAALDMRAIDKIENRELFLRLCAVQRRLGPASSMGLGAYFDPDKPDKGSGRFHVDVSGYRSWGFSQRSGSSGCRVFQ